MRKTRLTPQQMYRIYVATRDADAPVDQILRQFGLDYDDLEQIEARVESRQRRFKGKTKGRGRADDDTLDWDDY